ncbi:hypothetical protein [Bacteroides reticulotermitis]|uniref:Uncharacterized protein n=1 Tax=Bacteroides reticulotermitis TaxID=1133319 RepID=A0A840CV83_9BACE|nr:hypothetical protein [Bacteroides reticulotermitis]MBB4043790.1 hypothetical protein [Bacteroides reticulotermitis]
MLDLNILENKLNEALENETIKSMTDWIIKRKAKSLSSFVGETENYTQMDVLSYGFSVKYTVHKERYSSNMRNNIYLTEDLLSAS